MNVLLILVWLITPLLAFEQQSVPAVLFSYNLASGVVERSGKYDSNAKQSQNDFLRVAKDLISQCHSETYVFVNQPGLSVNDFKTEKKSMSKLYNYVRTSSTALKFNEVDILENDDIFEELIDFAMRTCKIQDKIYLPGDITDRYAPFVEARTRVIRVDFPPLPQKDQYIEDEGTRTDVLAANDEYFRYIVGTLPTPKHTVIYMSLEKSIVPTKEESLTYDIWPEVFADPQRKVEIDRNDRVSKEMPTLVPYRPRIEPGDEEYMSALSGEFLEKHYGIILLIVSLSLSFVLLQLGNVVVKKPKQVTEQKKMQ